jgi:hypothetical protein
MAANTTWREQIEELPESAFPYVYPTNSKECFSTRDDMLAAYEWFAVGGKGKAVERVDTDTFGIAYTVAGQWKNRKAEVGRAATAREAKLAPLKAANERRAKEKHANRAEKQRRMWELLDRDAKQLAAELAAALKDAGNIDLASLSDVAGRYSSFAGRLRFQISKTRRQADVAYLNGEVA